MRSLLPDTRFVLKPEFQLYVCAATMQHLFQAAREFSLKSSSAPGFFFG
jgi:hypothetical protein